MDRSERDAIEYITRKLDVMNRGWFIQLRGCLSSFQASRDASHALGIIYGWLNRNCLKMAELESVSERVDFVVERFRRYASASAADSYTYIGIEMPEELKLETEVAGKLFDEALMDLQRIIEECEDDEQFLVELRKAVLEVCEAEPGYRRRSKQVKSKLRVFVALFGRLLRKSRSGS